MQKTGKDMLCKECGKSFYATAYDISNGRSYCSPRCYWDSKKGQPVREKTGRVIECEVCGKKMYRPLNEIRNRKHLFCSLKCYWKFRETFYVGEQHPNWKGKPYHAHDGYKKAWVKSKQSQYEHILVAEGVLGRKLKKGEVVHHINEDPSDNRPQNLKVMSHSEHIKYHKGL